ncbi:FAD-binding oxidoreductase [Thermomonospora cellulosilytica]|uniref:FAD/FMN-containing dehydrogenase n=1 Tax=Thermomonospora cellulosilytica TaxID=1411118 RepID=A0A7W3RBT6_9ACTN|nr:FAD-binding oxidoreductase [Thermomonospora cellulosilytica]MBA9007753.1 FAD/FMN-containing dehydrogenase [Thermomonospora cellulosilytica]
MLSPEEIRKLRPRLDAQIITPADAGYDAARAVYPAGIDHRPAVVIRPDRAEQVAQVVLLARETGMPLSVRGGGHSTVGHGVCDGGIMLDLAHMRALDIDVATRTAWVQAGMSAGEYTVAAEVHGLATGFGDTGTVGIGGLTLGGGIGYLVRKHGLTIDNLLAAEIVTADGRIRQVDENNHPDLFWAIRGGGGNFGVATRFRFRLHPVRSIVGGMLVLPATAEVIRSFVAEAEAAPDELSTIANIMPAPPMPFLPEEQHGRLVLMATLCYAGPSEAGERVLAPFRALATPLADMLQTMPYSGLYPPEDEDFHPLAASHTMFVDTVGAAEAETILDFLQSSTAMMPAAQLRVLGGAMARVPAEATAFAHRQSRIMVNLAAIYEAADEAGVHEAWIRRFADAIRQRDHGAYVNLLGDEGPDRIRAAYPGRTWDRLRAIKAKYDPTNLFRLNQNIPPGVDG